MPTWLWPATRKAETTVLARFGRVVHWLGVATGGAMLLTLVVAPFLNKTPTAGTALAVVTLGIVPIMIGRGLRYILADE